MLSEKENFLRALAGVEPEYVPRYNLFWMVRPSCFMGDRAMGVGKDMFGVEWTKEGSAFDAPIPRNDYFILDDIRHWRDVIKFPDFSYVNWEEMAKKDLKDRDPELPRGGELPGGFFQNVMAFMGFTEGLLACYEEPDEVKALVNYICDCYLEMADDFYKYYQPDYIWFPDDIAAERAPFLSVAMFRDIFEPVWRRSMKFFKDRGLLAVHHNCGRFEDYLDDVVDMGFNGWDPAQTSNDLVGIKKKFGNKLMILGGFDSRPFLPFIEATEDDCRGAIRKLLDDLAPGGGFGYAGGMPAGPDADPVTVERSGWMNDEFEKLRYSY